MSHKITAKFGKMLSCPKCDGDFPQLIYPNYLCKSCNNQFKNLSKKNHIETKYKTIKLIFKYQANAENQAINESPFTTKKQPTNKWPYLKLDIEDEMHIKAVLETPLPHEMQPTHEELSEQDIRTCVVKIFKKTEMILISQQCLGYDGDGGYELIFYNVNDRYDIDKFLESKGSRCRK